MREKMKSSLIFILTIVVLGSKCWALVPIDSLVLGNFADTYTDSNDPLNYVFGRDKTLQSTPKMYKKQLAIYRGFSDEGKNLMRFCQDKKAIRYSTDWKKIQVMRAMVSELQFIGLDLASRAIPQYAKALEFSEDDYTHLVDGLVGNFCSANLSVISKKELRTNLIVKFKHDNNYKLPSIEGNPFFPDNMDSYYSPKKALEQEFKFTVKISNPFY